MSPRARDANLDLLKWLAMLSMLLDHLRYVWPQSEWLFIVGRLAFPKDPPFGLSLYVPPNPGYGLGRVEWHGLS